jgi:5-methylcytosine-specific restriction endonuclease McrA
VSSDNPYDAHHRLMRALVLAEAGHRCHYCGERATEADHVLEVANGGGNERSNYVAACKSCNSKRGAQLGGQRRQANRLHNSRRW